VLLDPPVPEIDALDRVVVEPPAPEMSIAPQAHRFRAAARTRNSRDLFQIRCQAVVEVAPTQWRDGFYPIPDVALEHRSQASSERRTVRRRPR
jgi:hypothetical protein